MAVDAGGGAVQFYLPIAEMPVNVLLLLGVGAAVGFVAGMFGVGGGFLLTPFLIFMGIPTAVAVATASAQIAASSVTGAISAWQKRAVDPKLGAILIGGGLVGTFLGILFFNAMRRLGQLDLVISLSYIVLLVSIGGLMLAESLRSMLARHRGATRTARQPGTHRWYEGLPFKVRFTESRLYASALPFLATGLVFGFIGAVLGIGGGFMLVPALIYIFRVPINVVVGTSQFQILSTMLTATLMHATTSGSLDMILALILIVGGVFGAQMGVRAGQRLKGEQFRLMLALLILGVGARFASDMLLRPEEPFSIVRTGGEVRR
jgi:uncharacterized membrane protein YfcA